MLRLGNMPRKRKRDWNSRHPKNKSNNETQAPDEAMPPPADVVIDGSLGEGGGQIIRLALALSSILDRSVRIDKIRYNRSKPGLRAQHANGAQLVGRIAQAECHGATIGSSSLTLAPPTCSSRDAHVALPVQCVVGTAGAITLVLQAALPCALRLLPSSPGEHEQQVENQLSTLQITGGTTVPFAPASEYIRAVLVPNLNLFGVSLKYIVQKHGFFPEGNGVCSVRFDKSQCRSVEDASNGTTARILQSCDITQRGDIIAIEGVVLISGLKYQNEDLGTCMQIEATRVLKRFANNREGYPQVTDTSLRIETLSGTESRGGIVSLTLYAKTAAGTVLGSSAIWLQGESNKIAKSLGVDISKMNHSAKAWPQTAGYVAQVAADQLCADMETGAVVDRHMADQLCIFMAMAGGTSRLLIPEPTQHVLSVVDVCKQFGVNIQLGDVPNSSNRILTCEGVGVHLE